MAKNKWVSLGVISPLGMESFSTLGIVMTNQPTLICFKEQVSGFVDCLLPTQTVVLRGFLEWFLRNCRAWFFSSKLWTCYFTSWWFQPIWKNMLVKLDHFSKYGWKFQEYSKPPPRRWLQLVGGFKRYLHGFKHPRWCKISSINSTKTSL